MESTTNQQIETGGITKLQDELLNSGHGLILTKLNSGKHSIIAYKLQSNRQEIVMYESVNENPKDALTQVISNIKINKHTKLLKSIKPYTDRGIDDLINWYIGGSTVVYQYNPR